MGSSISPEEQLRAENAALRAKLEEAEDTLRAIRKGELDSIVVETEDGPKLFFLDAAEAASNRFRGHILEQVSDAVIALDPEQRLTFLNAAAERLYRVGSGAVLGRKVSEIYTRHGPFPEGEAAAWSVLREHGEWRGEGVQRLHDGRELHVESSMSVLRGADGTEAGMLEAIRDISVRKQAEADRQQGEQFLKRVTDVTPGVIYVFDLETQCSVFTNRSMAGLLSYTPEEGAAMGDNVAATLMHPDDLARFPAHLERVRALRDGEIAEFEHRMRDRAGEWHWFHSRDAVFARDAAGVVSQLIGTAIEITERKRSAADLQRVSVLLDTLLHTAPIGFCFLDRDLRFVRINERLAEINGIPAGAHLGRHVSEVVPNLVESLRDVTGRILATGEAVLNHEFSGETPAAPGVTRFWSESWYPVRNGAGEVMGFGGVVEEITAHKQAEAALREADRRKDEFLATLAHELRNPLAPIRTGIDLLRRAEDRSPLVVSLTAMMERQIGHMVRLVDDLMDVSRVASGKLRLQPERVPLSSVVTDAVEAVRPLIKERGHVLTVTMPPTPIVLDMDPVRMTQVISNLLNNAAKFTDPKGRIALTVVQQSNEVVISVTDTGVGVAVADLPRIFDLFAQIDQSRDRSPGGLGIGLALSKRLAEMHGGTIHATSAGVGLGSEFVVRLPLGHEAPTTLEPSKPEGQVPSGTSRRILVVDDNRDGADTLSMLLRVDGHDTQAAYDGKSALEVAEAFRPEVVLLDIGLPMMDGYDVCRHLRAQTWATGLLVIALTGWGSAQDRRRAQDAGIDHHLVKPVEPAALRQMLAMPSLHDGRPPGVVPDGDPGRAPAPRG